MHGPWLSQGQTDLLLGQEPKEIAVGVAVLLEPFITQHHLLQGWLLAKPASHPNPSCGCLPLDQ